MMTHYAGNKSLDAEIVMDFVTGDITMDYSLNKMGSSYSSNRSAILNSEWRELPLKIRLKYAAIVTFLSSMGVLVVGLYTLIFITLSNVGVIKDPKTQYEHQELMRKFYSYLAGTYEQYYEGKLSDSVLTFVVPNNLWIKYELTDEYLKKIKSISLLRNFLKHKRFGISSELKQDGWKMVFEFIEPPSSGSCTIKYVG